MSGPAAFKSLSHSHYSPCGIASDDRIYCWGKNDTGQLGRGFSSAEEHDVAPIVSAMTFSQLAVSAFHACGLGTDGELYCWGYLPILGLTATPTRIDTELRFSSISLPHNRICGIATDGFAYCAGGGLLGDGTDRSSATFVRVAGQE